MLGKYQKKEKNTKALNKTKTKTKVKYKRSVYCCALYTWSIWHQTIHFTASFIFVLRLPKTFKYKWNV